MELGMKSSGVELIGKIPEAWKIMRLKFFLKDIKDGEHGKIKRVADGELFLSAKNISETGLSIGTIESHISKKDYQRIVSNGFPHKNDILFSCVGSIGKCCIYTKDKPIAFQRSVAFLQPNNKIDVKYILYCLQSDMCRAQIEKLINQSTVGGLYLNLIRELFITIPPKDEVKNIVSWLDRNCLAVSHTIDVTRQSIKKLEEYKASVISKAVTKGLNPNVKMQDSDVEWMGRIPAHWRTFRMKFLLKEKMKYGANAAGVHFDEKLPRYVRITDIDNETNRLKDEGRLSLPLETATPYLLDDKDILFARSGATVGKSFFYRKEHGQAAYAGYLIRAQVDSRKALPEFVYYYTQSSYYRIWKDYIFTQATIQNINAQKYGDFILAIPSIKEQEAIISYLDAECASVDRLIAQKQQLIEKFTEYKQSLIYAAVTGKIDCREEALK